MGNSNSSQIKDTLSLESWNLSHLPILRENLGNRSYHLYSSYPKKIPQENIYSNIDIRHFSCPDGDILSSFLQKVQSHIQLEFVKENWIDNAYPSNQENFKLLEQELKGVNLTEEELVEIRQMFGLPLEVNDLSIEDTVQKVEKDNKKKTLDITGVYRGYSIYEFPENSLSIPLENKMVSVDSCFVGSLDNKLVVMAPSEEPNLSHNIRFDWSVVQVGQDRIKLILEDARGFIFNEKSEKIVGEVEENYFQNLISAHHSFESNKSREMALYGRRYLAWVKKTLDEGNIRALAGGEIEGEIVSLRDFFKKMNLE